jgi:hypothetical protein
MTHKALDEASTGTSESLKALIKMDDDVDALHQAIITYLERLAQQQLLVQQSVQLSNFWRPPIISKTLATASKSTLSPPVQTG